MPGDDDAGAHGKTVEEAYEQEDQTGGAADRAQGIVAKKVTHAPTVESVIELLKQIPQKYRQSEQQQAFHDGAIRQGMCFVHSVTSFCHR